jgi:hypothetical protein
VGHRIDGRVAGTAVDQVCLWLAVLCNLHKCTSVPLASTFCVGTPLQQHCCIECSATSRAHTSSLYCDSNTARLTCVFTSLVVGSAVIPVTLLHMSTCAAQQQDVAQQTAGKRVTPAHCCCLTQDLPAVDVPAACVTQTWHDCSCGIPAASSNW